MTQCWLLLSCFLVPNLDRACDLAQLLQTRPGVWSIQGLFPRHPQGLPPPPGRAPRLTRANGSIAWSQGNLAPCMGPSWDTSTPFSGGLAFFLILQCNQGAQGPFAGRIGKSDAQPQKKEVPAQTRVQKLRGMILRKPRLFDCRPVRPKCNSCVSKLRTRKPVGM